MKAQYIIIVSAVAGALAVALGAFGAHALQAMLEASGRVATFETAVKYQFYHSLLLLAVGIMYHIKPLKGLQWSAYLLMLGLLLFSGSLYLIVFTGVRAFGMIAPIGGFAFIGAWLLLAFAAAQWVKRD
jgi:uncharacterized membrane protein YgdD (TMEM256/DUF423 family)